MYEHIRGQNESGDRCISIHSHPDTHGSSTRNAAVNRNEQQHTVQPMGSTPQAHQTRGCDDGETTGNVKRTAGLACALTVSGMSKNAA